MQSKEMVTSEMLVDLNKKKISLQAKMERVQEKQ